jgi:hypothetical protein
MPRFQFSLRNLLLTFIPAGLAVAALVNANENWANIALTVTLACLGISIVGWIWCLHGARAFWSGFTVFGCGYMLLIVRPWFVENMGRFLISNQILESAAGLFGHLADNSSYLLVGHCLFTLLSGLFGGLVGRWLYARREIMTTKDKIGTRSV